MVGENPLGKVDDQVDSFGPCCACGSTIQVRNVLMLRHKAPIPGTGWGCVRCLLPNDGAIAVVCDSCLEGKKPLRETCLGFPAKKERIPIEKLEGHHEHDHRFHPETKGRRWNPLLN